MVSVPVVTTKFKKNIHVKVGLHMYSIGSMVPVFPLIIIWAFRLNIIYVAIGIAASLLENCMLCTIKVQILVTTNITTMSIQ